MNIFKLLHETMDKFSESIAAEIAEKRFYQMDEVKAIAKTRLWMAIYECLKLQVTEKEEEMRKLVELYGETRGSDRVRIGTVLSKVKAEKADANRLLHTMGDYDEYQQLRRFVKEKFGDAAIKDFGDNYLERPDFKKRKIV